jgi:hypothetical protein
MKKIIISILLFTLFIAAGDHALAEIQNGIFTEEPSKIYTLTMKQDLLCLMMAYPEYITNIERNSNGNVYVIMKSGKKLLYDDKREKNPAQKLNNPDLQDMLEQIYPLSSIGSVLDDNFDPGRCRVYPLLSEVYGYSKQSIETKLTNVNFGYRNYLFNNSNKAASSLQSINTDLQYAAQRNPNVNKYLFPCSGTFNYRIISGTNQLSPHSFGIAIDLAVSKKDYWKWSSKADGTKRLSTYPNEIVEAFEKNNFIWGGKWGHFDIMHFEYRPEIIFKARYFNSKQSHTKSWYDGVPSNDIFIMNKIEKINQVLE